MIKVAIRQGNEAGVVRAFFSTPDDTKRFEVATLLISLAEHKPTFEAWKAMLTAAMQNVLVEAGVEVLGFRDVRPHEKQ